MMNTVHRYPDITLPDALRCPNYAFATPNKADFSLLAYCNGYVGFSLPVITILVKPLFEVGLGDTTFT